MPKPPQGVSSSLFFPFSIVNLSGKRGEQKQQKIEKNTVSFKDSAQCVNKWCIPYYKSKRVCFSMVLPHNNILLNIVLSPSFFPLPLSPHLFSLLAHYRKPLRGKGRERRIRKRTVCPRGKRRRGEEKHFFCLCVHMCMYVCVREMRGRWAAVSTEQTHSKIKRALLNRQFCGLLLSSREVKKCFFS